MNLQTKRVIEQWLTYNDSYVEELAEVKEYDFDLTESMQSYLQEAIVIFKNLLEEDA